MKPNETGRSSLVAVIGTVGGPIILFTVYLIFSRWLPVDRAAGDLGALAVSVAVGVWFLFRLAWPLSGRIVAALFYIPLFGFFLGFYGLIFVCSVFGDCL